MDKENLRKILLYSIGPLIVLVTSAGLFKHIQFMCTAESVAVQTVRYDSSISHGRRNKTTRRTQVVFKVHDGQYAGQSHSMNLFPFIRFESPGDISPGRYSPTTEVVMTNKHCWSTLIIGILFVALGFFASFLIIRKVN